MSDLAHDVILGGTHLLWHLEFSVSRSFKFLTIHIDELLALLLTKCVNEKLSVAEEIVLILVENSQELLDLSVVKEWDPNRLVHHIVCLLESLHDHLLIEEPFVLNVKILKVDHELVSDTTLLELIIQFPEHIFGGRIEGLDDRS